MLDSHCHVDDPRFDDDRPAALERARAAGVRGLIVAGYGPERWPAQAALARAHDGVVATFGLTLGWGRATPRTRRSARGSTSWPGR